MSKKTTTIKKELHGLVDQVYDAMVDLTVEAIHNKAMSDTGHEHIDLIGQGVNSGDYVVYGKEAWGSALVVYHVHKVKGMSVYCTQVKSKAKNKREFVFRTRSVVKIDSKAVLYYKLTN